MVQIAGVNTVVIVTALAYVNPVSVLIVDGMEPVRLQLCNARDINLPVPAVSVLNFHSQNFWAD